MDEKLAKKRHAAWKKFEPRLQVADILLIREPGFTRRSIRKVLNSYWNHSVLIFYVPTKQFSFNNYLVVGAEAHGIEIHRIQKYTHNFDKYDLGVKRVPGLTREVQEKVLSYMLNNVDIPYDYTRLVGFLVEKFENIFRRGNSHLRNFLINRDAFICSSFIQKAFYDAVPNERKESVIFSTAPKPVCLEEVTPADIAKSNKCDWLYNERY